jgi:hypothetical protein
MLCPPHGTKLPKIMPAGCTSELKINQRIIPYGPQTIEPISFDNSNAAINKKFPAYSFKDDWTTTVCYDIVIDEIGSLTTGLTAQGETKIASIELV